MAQKPFLIMTMIDFRRSTSTGDSRANIIQKVVLGGFKFKTVQRSAGGGIMDMEYQIPRLEAIELAVSVNGFDEDLMPGVSDRWTFAAALRDNKGKRVAARLEVEGVITEWTPDEQTPDDFKGCNSAIKEIGHIELHFDGKEFFYADEAEREIRRKGVSITSADRAALGI